MRFGISDKLGPRVYGHDHGQPFLGREFSTEPDYSDEIAREINDEVRGIIEGAPTSAPARSSASGASDLDRISRHPASAARRSRRSSSRSCWTGATEADVFGPDEPRHRL